MLRNRSFVLPGCLTGMFACVLLVFCLLFFIAYTLNIF
jgi:hypothetical protein